MQSLLATLFLALLLACHTPEPPVVMEGILIPASAWDAPSALGPVLVGTVRHPDGQPLANIQVTAHGGFATRFPLETVRTDSEGRYRFDPAVGSPTGGTGGEPQTLYCGVCVGSVRNVNPPTVLPWIDVSIETTPGTVARQDFIFDPESVPEQYRD